LQKKTYRSRKACGASAILQQQQVANTQPSTRDGDGDDGDDGDGNGDNGAAPAMTAAAAADAADDDAAAADAREVLSC
jgi:hypothetical protein